MPFVHKQNMSPQQIAANRANAQQSQGPATLEGKAQVAKSNLKHGFYSRFFQEAMGALGEDPSEFDQVRERLMEYWAPQDPLTEALVNRLARLMWRLERLEARQERYGTRYVKARQVGEAARAKAVDPQLESILDHLDALQEALQARDWSQVSQTLEEWRQCGGIGTTQEKQIFQSQNRVAAAPSAPAQVQDELAEELKRLVAEELELVEEYYEESRELEGTAAAQRWLERMEASTNPEALSRAEELISRELERAVRLLRQLLGGPTGGGEGQPAVRKTVGDNESHYVVENK
jgi:hypothetical protein